ncbi:MAG: GNAT family N-acetyltransferase [Promethearchaeia archaeon]
MIEIERYDPRKDKDALKEIFEDFIQNKCYFSSNWEEFEKELDKRSMDLQYRNGMVVAKEDGNLVGFGTYTMFTDYLGNNWVLIHQVITRKQDAYRKGIEEKIIEELQLYVKRSLGEDKAYYICLDSDGSKRSTLMKMGIKKSDKEWYEKEL